MADAGIYRPPDYVAEVVKRWDEAQSHHKRFVSEYERRERAYRGVLRRASSAAKWRHAYNPKYAFNLIETIVSNTEEMGLAFDVRPSPVVNPTLEEAQQMLAQAENVNYLLRHEHRLDDMDFKQRPLYLTGAIGGRGIGKVYYLYEKTPTKKWGYKDQDITDDNGNVLGTVPVISEVDDELVRDHTTFEVCDPRDWTTHESARHLDPCLPGGAQYVIHRTWYSFEQLKWLEADGFFENVDRLKDAAIDFSGEYSNREREVWDVNRTKDLIEVLEFWKYEQGCVWRSYVGNRAIGLRDLECNPFWHGKYPFVISASMSQPFTTIGFSDVELIETLQEMLWEMGSQRADNIELVNNFISLVRSDVDDEGFEFYPGARWYVDGSVQNAVAPLQPPYQLAQLTIEAEGVIKGDMQNVTSATPFASGADTQTVDNKTATGASMVMNAAQQRLVSKKFHAQKALREEANLRIKLAQQFMPDKRLVTILGKDGEMMFRELSRLQIQGDYFAELKPMGESQMRQERRAEGMQFAQFMLQAAPLAAAAGVPMNIQEVLKWTLDRWDIIDKDRFFSAMPSSLGAMGGSAAPGVPGRPGQPPQAPGAPNIGVTAPSAVDASSPSAVGGISGSPVVALQRALAMGGGANNIPRG